MRATSVSHLLLNSSSCLQLQSQEMAGSAGLTEAVKQAHCIRFCQQYYSIPGTGCRSVNELSHSQVKTLSKSTDTILVPHFWCTLCSLSCSLQGSVQNIYFLYDAFPSYPSTIKPLVLSRTSISLSPRHQLTLRLSCRGEVTTGPTWSPQRKKMSCFL